MNLPRFYRVSPEYLPAVVPRIYVPPPAIRSPNGGYDFNHNGWQRAIRLDRDGWRELGVAMSRDATVWVPGRWYWYAKLELFLAACLSFAFICFIRTGLIRAPYEGAFFHEYRFDPPDLWGSPIRRHDNYWQKPPQFRDIPLYFEDRWDRCRGWKFFRVYNW